jgi:hypothetical protein
LLYLILFEMENHNFEYYSLIQIKSESGVQIPSKISIILNRG